jgi:phage terminase large subunit-like protein
MSDVVTVSAHRATVGDRRVRLDVLAADAPSAWGLRPYFVIVDEIAQWAETRRSLQLYEAVQTAAGKVNGRMVLLTTAGDPTHFSARIRAHAQDDPLWRVHEVPGPVPWVSPARLEEQRRALTDAAFRRLHLNEWAEAEDRLASLRDLEACVRPGGAVPPRANETYVIGLDVGLVNDRTAAAVCHLEVLSPSDGEVPDWRLVVDDVRVWEGSRERPVQLAEVRAWLAATVPAYNYARVVFDPHQAMGLAQDLRHLGLRAEQFNMTPSSVARLATTLISCIRARDMSLPDDPALVRELARVRVIETAPNRPRLDHAAGEHDDRATAISLALVSLLERPPWREARIRVLAPR